MAAAQRIMWSGMGAMLGGVLWIVQNIALASDQRGVSQLSVICRGDHTAKLVEALMRWGLPLSSSSPVGSRA